MSSLSNCSECPLSKWRGQKEIEVYRPRRATAIYQEIGYRGNRKAKIILTGESPGGNELLWGKAFVGDAGLELVRVFNDMGLSPLEKFVYITNSCRCMVLKDEMTDKEVRQAMACCRPRLEAAIREIKPKLIVVLGNIALQQILKQSGITKKRGNFTWSEEFGCWVYATYHPAFCLRDRDKFTQWNPDMMKIGQFVDNGYQPQDVAEEFHAEEVQSIAFLWNGHQPKRVGLDTETQGTDTISPNHLVISVGVSDQQDRGYTMVLFEEGTEEKHDLVIQWPRKKLTKKERDAGESNHVPVYVKKAPHWKRRIREVVRLVTDPHIAKYVMTDYDFHQLEWLGQQIGVDLSPPRLKRFSMDVQTAAHCLNPDALKMASLQDIHRVFCPERPDHKAIGLVNRSDMLQSLRMDRERFMLYASKDPADTLAVGNVLRRELAKDKKLVRYYKHFVQPITKEVLYRIKRTGILFDSKGVAGAKEQVAKLIAESHKNAIDCIPSKIKQDHRDKLKLSRGDLIADTLFSRKGFRLPVLELSKKTRKPSITKSVFKHLKETLDPQTPAYRFINELEKWKPYSRLYSTNLKGFEKAVRADGRIHTEISIAATGTGRSASRNPNLQNIPKRMKEAANIIRKLLIARPGFVLIPIDYSQAELRHIAVRAHEKAMLEIYKRGLDIHMNTAKAIAELAKLNWDSLSNDQQSDMRRKAKSVGFGYIYGMMPPKFRSYAYDEYGLSLSLRQAEEFRDLFFSLYPGLPPWHRREIAFGQNHGYSRSPLGRIRLLPNIHSEDFRARSEDERRAINFPIQSAASDCALLGAREAIRSGLVDDKDVFLSLFVHDEVVFEIRETVYERRGKEILDCMENLPLSEFDVEFPIPMVVEAGVGYNLSELEEFSR